MSETPVITMIAAAARNRVIGMNNQLPWHLPEDLKFFKAKTLGKPVIMGRKTYDSMGGGPLPRRRNIIISRNRKLKIKGVDVVASLDEALQVAATACKELGVDEIMVAGGEQIYRQALAVADRVYITDVELEPEGDAFFPELDDTVWQEVNCAYPERVDQVKYRFLTFEKKASDS